MKKIVVNRVMIREISSVRRYIDKLNTDYPSCYDFTFDIYEKATDIVLLINTGTSILTTFDFKFIEEIFKECGGSYLSFISFEKGSFILKIYYKKDDSFDTMLAVGK